jgi:hypothetical protein
MPMLGRQGDFDLVAKIGQPNVFSMTSKKSSILQK